MYVWTVPDRVRPPRVSWYTLMAMFDGVDPSEWNESMFSQKGRFSMLPFILDAVVRRLVPVNLLMQVAVMALWGVG